MDLITQIIPFSVALEGLCTQAATLSDATLEAGAKQLAQRSESVAKRELSVEIDSAFAKVGW